MIRNSISHVIYFKIKTIKSRIDLFCFLRINDKKNIITEKNVSQYQIIDSYDMIIKMKYVWFFPQYDTKLKKNALTLNAINRHRDIKTKKHKQHLKQCKKY